MTVDAHAHDLAGGRKTTAGRPHANRSDYRGGLSGGGVVGNGRYDHFLNGYLTAAHTIDPTGSLHPRSLQATDWEVMRSIHPRASGHVYDPASI